MERKANKHKGFAEMAEHVAEAIKRVRRANFSAWRPWDRVLQRAKDLGFFVGTRDLRAVLRCPVCEGRAVAYAEPEDRVRFECPRGCGWADIVRALQLTREDMAEKRPFKTPSGREVLRFGPFDRRVSRA